MPIRLAAIAACLFVVVALPMAWAQQPFHTTLSLDGALLRVAQSHPALRLFGARHEVLLAELMQAEQIPPRVLTMEIENVVGSGVARDFDAAELSLSLASVFERGGKLDARRSLAQSRIDALAVQREVTRLDLLALVARRYLAAQAARSRAGLAEQNCAARQRTLDAVRQRHAAGALPLAALRRAEAELSRAELDRQTAAEQARVARQLLAALWAEHEPQFELVAIDVLKLPKLAEFAQLAALLGRTPELRRFADQQRIAEAQLRLAQSTARADWTWQLGLRRLPAGDVALVGGVSMPWGASVRAEPAIDAARSGVAALAINQKIEHLDLYTTLLDAHGRYRVASLTVQQLRQAVLPRLQSAERATAKAFAAGATRYLDWRSAQDAVITAQTQQLEAAVDAYTALIELQRLCGQSVLATTAEGDAP